MVAQDMAVAVYEAPPAPARGHGVSGLILPIARPEEVRAAVEAFEAMKRAILSPEHDVVRIGDKDAIKRSGWDKLALGFGISVEPVREEYVERNGSWGYLVVVRAVAPTGASMIGDGACFAEEKRVTARPGRDGKPPADWQIAQAARKSEEAMTDHNVRAHAYTRATNRAISNLVGGGEVSAEELQRYSHNPTPPPTGEPQRQIAGPTPDTRQAAPQGRQAAPATKAAPAPVTADEMTAMTARFKALKLERPQVNQFVATHCGEGKRYDTNLTRADWQRLDKALATYEAKMAKLTGASGTVAEAAGAVVAEGEVIDADPAPAPAVLDLAGEDYEGEGA